MICLPLIWKNILSGYNTSEGLFLGYLINAKQVTGGESQFYADLSGQQALAGG